MEFPPDLNEIRYDVAFAWFDACSRQDSAGEALTG